MKNTYRRTCNLGFGYKVEFILKNGSMNCVWDPQLPPREIGKMLIPAYQRERDAFFESLGFNVLVVDL